MPTSKLPIYAIYFTPLKIIFLEYFLFSCVVILKIFNEIFETQDENRRMEILEAFHTIREPYRQIFLICHEMEDKRDFGESCGVVKNHMRNKNESIF